MELVEMIIIALQITAITAKKKHRFRAQSDPLKNSGESIENLLYYKDCKHKNKEPSQAPIVAVSEPPREPICPCPRMCCSMCCDCNAPQPFMGRQMAPLQSAPESMLEPIQVAPQPPRRPMPQMPVQPQIMRVTKRKKPKVEKPPDPLSQPPIGSRRSFAFTRDNIKSLISHDQDIKKILKDLVRVTMHKVDLVEQVNARRSMITKATTMSPESEHRSKEEEYGDL